MVIKPSTCLRNEYNDIAEFCKTENQPVFLTKNGEGDLVVMSMEAYSYREEMLDLREKLLEAERKRAERDNRQKKLSRKELKEAVRKHTHSMK